MGRIGDSPARCTECTFFHPSGTLAPPQHMPMLIYDEIVTCLNEVDRPHRFRTLLASSILVILSLKIRAGHSHFFRAFALASAKLKKARKREEKKARKKAKAPSAKEKSVNSCFFLSLPSIALEARFQGPTWPTGGGGGPGVSGKRLG